MKKIALSIFFAAFTQLLTAQPEKPYIIVATIEAKEGCEKKLERLLLNTKKLSTVQEGSRGYKISQGIEAKNKYFLYEEWESKDAHEKFKAKFVEKGLMDEFGKLVSKVDMSVTREVED